MSADQRKVLITGEYFFFVSRAAGVLSAQHLMRARWGYRAPEWYDHRNHLLDPSVHFTDFGTMSANNAIEKMPMGARVLDLCSGDGFYAYYFYRHRASEVVCIERGDDIHRHAVRLHSAENIRHVHASVFDADIPADHFETVLIRGAIEHFSEDDQQRLFRRAYDVLKPGGWFCGDTPANPEKHTRMLPSHECEWADEEEMRAVLSKVFPVVVTRVLISEARTTLLWQCQKSFGA
jgi:SAM-dependent methyltransferase